MIVVQLISFGVALFEVIKIIRNITKGKKLRDVIKSADFKILIASFLLATCFFIPWHKFHYGDQITKTVYVTRRDTTDAHRADSKIQNKDTSHNQPKNPYISVRAYHKSIHKRLKQAAKSDSVKSPIKSAKNVVAAPNYGNLQNGDNNTQNNFILNQEKELSEREMADIYSQVEQVVKDRGAQKVFTVVSEPYCNAPLVPNQIASYLKQRGYSLHGFGTAFPGPNSAFIDGYQIIYFGQGDINIYLGHFK